MPATGHPATRSPSPSLTCEITLAALATAVGCARVFVRSTVKALGLDSLREDAELIASELVTNAVKATGIITPSPRWSELDDLALIRLRIVVIDNSLIIEVWDRDSAPPTPKDAENLDAEGGRGLVIVESLSRRWNFYGHAEGGKWVWAELAISPNPGPLPRRKPSPVPHPDGQIEVVNDPELLRRVRDGLKRI